MGPGTHNQVGRLQQAPEVLFSSPPQQQNYKSARPQLAFLCECWELNLSLHVCTSILLSYLSTPQTVLSRTMPASFNKHLYMAAGTERTVANQMHVVLVHSVLSNRGKHAK